MNALLIHLRDIALLRTPAYELARDRKDAMKAWRADLAGLFPAGRRRRHYQPIPRGAVSPAGMEEMDLFQEEFQRNMEGSAADDAATGWTQPVVHGAVPGDLRVRLPQAPPSTAWRRRCRVAWRGAFRRWAAG